jgi:hypothetical protein
VGCHPEMESFTPRELISTLRELVNKGQPLKIKRPPGRFGFFLLIINQLHMDRMPLGVVGGFHQGFAQRRVGMHIAGDLGRCELHHLRHG